MLRFENQFKKNWLGSKLDRLFGYLSRLEEFLSHIARVPQAYSVIRPTSVSLKPLIDLRGSGLLCCCCCLLTAAGWSC